MSKQVEVTKRPDCDFCQNGTLASYDGKTKQGPWAFMCETHFKVHGVGLGTGAGQKLIIKEVTECQKTKE
jgi:hypothetical protein